MKTTDKIIIIDLEATCWQGEVPKGQQNEIIEIGLAVLDSQTGEITKNKGILIKPQRSTVSLFCTELTTITQELLDKNGVSFEQAINQLKDEYQPDLYTWASYGQYDLNKLKNQCKSFGIPYPMGEDHINVKTWFAEKFGLQKPIGMNGALDLLRIKLEGTHHRGIDDAKNIAKIMHWCLRN
ncbi:3'-5' exonuclease [Flavobacterium reichenbachii]|uniref:DNA polymerase III n=1 Tax=Flavobacterium reichenbachii TaxID=362418 RepID=A0A085ZLW3_9FLAO|nr:3'-5' exonuclease [Flavobacterium reichenbachii]KFF05427.1 DNA polymerase III [Flavobacterium reichenbachii]OXB12357.1 DNA polymerase III [Flavobacterium reichenbachii]